MIKCGITGHKGVLGSFLKKKLKYRFIKFNGDITKKKDVNKWIYKNDFDYVIHLAAIVPTFKVKENFIYSKKVNYNGTKNLVDAIIKYKKKPKNFFFSSTSHVYESTNRFYKIKETDKLKPYSKYGETKLLAEKYLIKKFSKKKINFCVGRIFSFTHIKQDNSYVVPNLFQKIKNSKKNQIFLNNLNHHRDFISIEDISKAIEMILKKNFVGVVNIGSGKKISLLKIAQFFCKKYKIKLKTQSNMKSSFMISNNRKLIKYGWKPKISFFHELKKFK